MRNTKSKLFFSLLYPSFFVATLWFILLFENLEHINLSCYGLYPRTMKGLLGIFTSPLLHADYNHLWANSIPLLILGAIIFYFYRTIAFELFLWIYLMTGFWVWVVGREAFHIGASGIVYGFITFLFFSGVFRKDSKLLALSMLVVFLYGGTLWGILPLRSSMSWESHLMGSIAGLITAYHYRKEGPPQRTYNFDDEEDDENLNIEAIDQVDLETEPSSEKEKNSIISYDFVPKEKKSI